MDQYKIPFQYERELLIKDKSKSRIWYPDFYLHTYGNIVIEYFGVENNEYYDKSYIYKKRVYSENHIDLIKIFPKDIRARNLKSKILDGINSILCKRMDEFKKIYNKNIVMKLPKSSESRMY